MSEWEIDLKKPMVLLDLIIDLWCLIKGWYWWGLILQPFRF
jgi:hypothetical protein